MENDKVFTSLERKIMIAVAEYYTISTETMSLDDVENRLAELLYISTGAKVRLMITPIK